MDGLPKPLHKETRSPWETDFAATVPRFTGGISAISSALIIYVILRSRLRFSTVYHRIMFCLSLMDIIGSVCMALTSLPMPSHMPREEEFDYFWAGARLGNTMTCNMQGFFVIFGMTSMFYYNGMLCVYYACAIAFGMREKIIKKKIEPILLSFPIIVGLGCAIPPLFFEQYNPAISNTAWCSIQSYPAECRYSKIDCVRGADIEDMLKIIFTVMVIADFFIIFISLVLVLWKSVQADKLYSRLPTLYARLPRQHRREIRTVITNHHTSKAVLIQALCYIAAFLLGLLAPVLRITGAVNAHGATEEEFNSLVKYDKFQLVFLPLQGFFNFLIFISHKVYNYRRINRDVSIFSVLRLLFCSSAHEPCFISRIAIVGAHADVETTRNVEALQEAKIDSCNDVSSNKLNVGEFYSCSSDSLDNSGEDIVQIHIHDEMNEMNYRLKLLPENCDAADDDDDIDADVDAGVDDDIDRHASVNFNGALSNRSERASNEPRSDTFSVNNMIRSSMEASDSIEAGDISSFSAGSRPANLNVSYKDETPPRERKFYGNLGNL